MWTSLQGLGIPTVSGSNEVVMGMNSIDGEEVNKCCLEGFDSWAIMFN